MIHYHGTPITRRDPNLTKLAGREFCVSYAQPQDAKWCIKNAQSVMWDNGAFSAYTRGLPFNKSGYVQWLDDKNWGCNWAVVPDVIGGSVEDQRSFMKDWPYPDHLSCYVWHMDLPVEWLRELVESHSRVAFGSSLRRYLILTDSYSASTPRLFSCSPTRSSRPER